MDFINPEGGFYNIIYRLSGQGERHFGTLPEGLFYLLTLRGAKGKEGASGWLKEAIEGREKNISKGYLADFAIDSLRAYQTITSVVLAPTHLLIGLGKIPWNFTKSSFRVMSSFDLGFARDMLNSVFESFVRLPLYAGSESTLFGKTIDILASSAMAAFAIASDSISSLRSGFSREFSLKGEFGAGRFWVDSVTGILSAIPSKTARELIQKTISNNWPALTFAQLLSNEEGFIEKISNGKKAEIAKFSEFVKSNGGLLKTLELLKDESTPIDGVLKDFAQRIGEFIHTSGLATNSSLNNILALKLDKDNDSPSIDIENKGATLRIPIDVNKGIQMEAVKLLTQRLRANGEFKDINQAMIDGWKKSEEIEFSLGSERFNLTGEVKDKFVEKLAETWKKSETVEKEIAKLGNATDEVSQIKLAYWQLQKKWYENYFAGKSDFVKIASQMREQGFKLIDAYEYQETKKDGRDTLKAMRKKFGIYDDLLEGNENGLKDIHRAIYLMENWNAKVRGEVKQALDNASKGGDKNPLIEVRNGVYLRANDLAKFSSLAVEGNLDIEHMDVFEKAVVLTIEEVESAISELKADNVPGLLQDRSEDNVKSDKEYYLKILNFSLEFMKTVEALGGKIVTKQGFFSSEKAIVFPKANEKDKVRFFYDDETNTIKTEYNGSNPAADEFVKEFNNNSWFKMGWKDGLEKSLANDINTGNVPGFMAKVLRIGYEYLLGTERNRAETKAKESGIAFDEAKFKKVFEKAFNEIAQKGEDKGVSKIDKQMRMLLSSLADKSVNMAANEGKTLPALLGLIIKGLMTAKVEESGEIKYLLKMVYVTTPDEVESKFNDYAGLFKKFGLELEEFNEG